MSAMMAGKKYRVYLEDMQGQMFEMDAIAAEINTSAPLMDITTWGDKSKQFASGMVKTDIHLVGVGDARWTQAKDFVNEKRTAVEWQCDFCKLPNPRSATFCGELNLEKSAGCGAVRSFLYNI